MLRQVYLYRAESGMSQTLGVLVVPCGREVWVCKTLELPWKENASCLSCVPALSYVCKWTCSPLFSAARKIPTFTYELQDVPLRQGIRIHSANIFRELKGCIALGSAHKDINADKELDVIHSGDTVKEFEKLMSHEDFMLRVGPA